MKNNAVLIINSGSSSLKFKLFNTTDIAEIFYGQIEGFGTGKPNLSIKNSINKDSILAKEYKEDNNRDEIILDVINNILHFGENYNISAIGHRVVHGGPKYTKPTVISQQTLEYLKSINHLAPLHMSHNLKPVEIIFNRLPNIKQVACFDTSFHTSASTVSKLYATDISLYEQESIMRYGAHGTSYEYISGKLKEIDMDLYNGKVVVCHLGSGASLCAMEKGVCVTTTMGFSVLEGLVMGTRPGNIDAGIILYLLMHKNYTPQQVEHLLYHKSGILGLSSYTNDFRLLQQHLDTNPLCKQAWDVFIFNLVKNIGSLVAVMGGVDGIVFTAGVGENSVNGRKQTLEKLTFLGVEIDNIANEKNSMVISTKSSKIKALVVPTNEELMIAKHTINMVQN